jgi:hypothetical protein
LRRLNASFAKSQKVQFIVASFTVGSWGNRLVSPEEEAGHLAEYFLQNQKLTCPVAIWKASKSLNEDNGMTPTSAGPVFGSYPQIGKPTIYVIDGKGVIRRVMMGLTREQEVQLALTIKFLQKEAQIERHAEDNHARVDRDAQRVTEVAGHGASH